MEIGLSLGSNLGGRLENLRSAVARIAEIPQLDVVAESSVYETEPIDVPPAHRHRLFLNMVVIVVSESAVMDIFAQVQAIEGGLGRRPGQAPNTPRAIDIDLIYAGDKVVRSADLTLPHPRWQTRRFVLVPLAEVRPGRILPGQRQSVADLLLSLPPDTMVVPLEV